MEWCTYGSGGAEVLVGLGGPKYLWGWGKWGGLWGLRYLWGWGSAVGWGVVVGLGEGLGSEVLMGLGSVWGLRYLGGWGR